MTYSTPMLLLWPLWLLPVPSTALKPWSVSLPTRWVQDGVEGAGLVMCVFDAHIGGVEVLECILKLPLITNRELVPGSSNWFSFRQFTSLLCILLSPSGIPISFLFLLLSTTYFSLLFLFLFLDGRGVGKVLLYSSSWPITQSYFCLAWRGSRCTSMPCSNCPPI